MLPLNYMGCEGLPVELSCLQLGLFFTLNDSRQLSMNTQYKTDLIRIQGIL